MGALHTERPGSIGNRNRITLIEVAKLLNPMKKLINKAFHQFYRLRYPRIRHFMDNPLQTQQEVLRELIQLSRHTEWGRRYGYKSIRKQDVFAERVPIQDYESLKPYINRMMHGEKDVLWGGRVRWFSKSSGTTNDKSKFIPVSPQNLKKCHIRGTWDTMNLYYHNRPNARQFECKSLLMGGSLENFAPYPKSQIGDVSAVMIKHMPFIARPFFTPDFNTALMSEWEAKIERIAQIASQERDMVMIGGVPSWTIVLFRRILEITGKQHMLEVWPNLEVYIHGGVGFDPYRKQFQQFLPTDQIDYMEIYNASEGYFAEQDDLARDDLLLLLDNGMYFEFLPSEEWDKENPQAISLEQVEKDKNYALVVSTNGGLWRYLPGDTVCFSSIQPYRIKITGRTSQFVNAFGEEVMVANTDKALFETCRQTNASVLEYTVAPVYITKTGKGGHEWLIEFDKTPQSIKTFSRLLDKNLQRINSDYEAKRYKNMALKQLKLQTVPRGTFHQWLKSKGKYGGQNKVPRLANHRKYLEEILKLLEKDYSL